MEKWLAEVTQEEGATSELYIRDAVWPTVALKKLVDSNVEVTQEDIQKGFDSNYGPRIEVLAIVLNNHRQAKAREMARDNPSEQFFGELAHQYSVDSVSRENFGRVPPSASMEDGRNSKKKRSRSSPAKCPASSRRKTITSSSTAPGTPRPWWLRWTPMFAQNDQDLREKKLRGHGGGV